MPATAVDPRRGAARGLRALVLAAVSVGVAGAAHTFVDGCADVAGLVLSLGICWPLAVALLGRRRRPAQLVAWAAAAQVVTHVVVELTCGTAAHATPLRVLAAHGLGVLVTTALLAEGDAGLWVAHALQRAFGSLVVPRLVVVPVLPVRRTAPASAPLPRSLFLVSPSALRGPPSASC